MTPAIASLPVSYQDVADAADRIRALIVETPLLEVTELSEAIGGRFFVKCENLQRTGSFKLRGGMNALSSLTAEERAKGVVAYSSGNHAHGVAAARRFSIIPYSNSFRVCGPVVAVVRISYVLRCAVCRALRSMSSWQVQGRKNSSSVECDASQVPGCWAMEQPCLVSKIHRSG